MAGVCHATPSDPAARETLATILAPAVQCRLVGRQAVSCSAGGEVPFVLNASSAIFLSPLQSCFGFGLPSGLNLAACDHRCFSYPLSLEPLLTQQDSRPILM